MASKKEMKKEQEIIDAAMKRLDRCIKAEDHSRKASIDDLKFANGEQWDMGEKKRRADKGRPALQFNVLQKFIDQVVGDMLHNQPRIKLRPDNAASDPKIANIRQGIIYDIEYYSNSKAVYGYGAKQMVTCGYGAWRVLTRYTPQNPFLQEAYLESIRNPFLVYMDPNSKDQNYADAKYGFILEKMPKSEFEERFPKAELPNSEVKTGAGLGSENWYDGELVTVAEYFSVEAETVTMLQLEDGQVVDEERFEKMKEEYKQKLNSFIEDMGDQPLGAPAQPPMGGPKPPIPQAPPTGAQPPAPGAGVPPTGPPSPLPVGANAQPGTAPQMQQPPPQPPPNPMVARLGSLGDEPKVAKRRETERPVIKHRILSCCEILDGGLEGNTFPGKFIPIVVVKGKELNVEGKNYVYSLIRHAKDGQRMLNYWQSAAAETIALAPKAPWIGTPKQFEGFENDYALANVENWPMLKYNPDPEAQGPPQRIAPAQPPMAIFQQINKSEDMIKSMIGLFNADVGAPGSEQTGAAIMARQRPGDIGTFEFSENMARAILYTGRILNSIIPNIYDTERDVRVRNEDDTETFMPVNSTVGHVAKNVNNNPTAFPGLDPSVISNMVKTVGKDAKFNDITVGEYGVIVTTGPSYATQRQESAQHLLQLFQAAPQQMAGALDLIVKNFDIKEADELERRLRKPLIQAGVVKPKPGEVTGPQQPNPVQMQMQAKMSADQARSQIAQVKLQQEQLKLQEQQLKLQIEQAKAKQELGVDMEDKRMTNAENARKHGLDMKRLQLEEAKFAHERQKDTADMMLRHGQHRHQQSNDQRRFALDASAQMIEALNVGE